MPTEKDKEIKKVLTFSEKEKAKRKKIHNMLCN